MLHRGIKVRKRQIGRQRTGEVDMRLSIAASFAAAFGKYEGSDVRRRRVVSIVQGLLTGVANRMVGVAVSLLSVPLTIGYLGSERYGVWTLISSLLA